MKYIVSQKPDIRYEALGVLERLASGGGDAPGFFSDCDAYCNYYLEEFAMPKEDADYVEAVRAACRHVAQHQRISDGDLKKFFRIIPEVDLSMAGLLMLADRALSGITPTEEQRIAVVLMALEVFPDDGEAAEKAPKTVAALSERLASSRFPDETKWACIDFCLNYQAHKKRAFSLLDETAALLMAKAEPLFAMCKKCADSLETLNAKGGLDALMSESGLTLDAEQCEIIPCAMRVSAISLQSNELQGADYVLMRYGVLVDELMRIGKEQRSAGDEILRVVKAMADKTRMQVIMKLKDAPMLGHDIIALTGLTAATVSHHMSELTSARLVTVEKQGTRILYRLSPERVERLITLLKDFT